MPQEVFKKKVDVALSYVVIGMGGWQYWMILEVFFNLADYIRQSISYVYQSLLQCQEIIQ